MTKRGFIYLTIQIAAFVLAFFVLGFALAGGHGKLNFFAGGWEIAAIMTIILCIPLIYLFTQRHRLQRRKLLLFIATLLFCLSMAAIYVGLPNVTKQFTINKANINSVLIYNDRDLTINLKLKPEMFDRVGIEANISKANSVEFNQFHLTVFDNKNKIITPVFRPLAWDSLHSKTIQMNSFFENTDYSKMNKFALSGQYSIEHTDSFKILIDYTFTKNRQSISNHKLFEVRISNHLILEKLIEY